MKTLATLSAAAFGLALAGSATAQDLRLRFDDLDLSRPDQAKVLDQRIDRAAQGWCDGQVQTGTILSNASCAATVRQQIVQALPAQARSAYEAARVASAPSAASRGA